MTNASSYTKPNNVIFLPGDRTAWYNTGTIILLHVTKYNTNTGEHIQSGTTETTISNSEYQSVGLTLQTDQKVFTGQPVTKITLPSPILTLVQKAVGTKGVNENYSINVTYKDGIGINKIGWYPQTHRNESINYVDTNKTIVKSNSIINNWFILDQNEVRKFSPGFQFKVQGEKIDGIYTTLWAKNYLDVNKTIIRVAEPINPPVSPVDSTSDQYKVSYVANSAKINEYFVGYDQHKNKYTNNNQYGLTNSAVSEQLMFNWESKDKSVSVHDGQQFKVIRTFVEGTGSATKNKIEVNGDATEQLLFHTDKTKNKINLIESSVSANNKQYTISEKPTKNTITKALLGSDYVFVDNKYDFTTTTITVEENITPQRKQSSDTKYFAGWIELKNKDKQIPRITDLNLPTTL